MYRVCPDCGFARVAPFAPKACPRCHDEDGNPKRLDDAAFHPRYLGDGHDLASPPASTAPEREAEAS